MIWNLWASALQFSWVAESGHNVWVKDVDIIHYESPPAAEGAAIWMIHGGSRALNNFHFENIVVESFGSKSCKSFLALEIKGSSYAKGLYGSLKDVWFKNIQVLEPTINYQMTGMDASHTISNIHFDNLSIKGQCITQASAANLTFNSFANNVTFNCNLTQLRKPALKSAAIPICLFNNFSSEFFLWKGIAP